MSAPSYPTGFRARRGLNWASLGLMYASYYMCRYNFRFATPGMQTEFGFSTTQIADMIAIWSLTYGTGQLVNGLLCDKIGGKRSLQIGAFGTILINLLLGLRQKPSLKKTVRQEHRFSWISIITTSLKATSLWGIGIQQGHRVRATRDFFQSLNLMMDHALQ